MCDSHIQCVATLILFFFFKQKTAYEIVMRVSPIQSNVPHTYGFLSSFNSWGDRVLLFWCSKQRPSNHRWTQDDCQGKDDLFISVEPCGGTSLSPAGFIGQAYPCSALV